MAWGSALIVACAPAIVIFLFRADLLWLEYQPATVGEIYALPPNIGPRIIGFNNDGGRLTVRTEPHTDCGGWRITGPDGIVRQITGRYPVLSLVQGRHQYRVAPTGCTDATDAAEQTFDIAYAPAASAAEVMFSHDIINLYRSPMPVAPRTGHALTRWVPPLTDYPADEVQRARRLLDDMGLRPEMSSLEKMRAVTAGLLKRAKPGLPPPRLDDMSPMQVIEAALSSGVPVFCRQRALMKAFLLNVAGVPTRLVWSGRTFDDVILSSHAFTESYVVEQGRWAYSDLSHRIAYMAAADGRVLSALDVLTLLARVRDVPDTLDWSGFIPTPNTTSKIPNRNIIRSMAGVLNENAMLQYWGAHDRFTQQINPGPLKTIEYRLRRYLFEPTLYIGPERGYTLHWMRGLSVLTAFAAVVAAGIAVVRRRWRKR
ncbi:MAG: hypothetical protein CMF64_05950 [Magnetovibrio sp.]|nr:hypothetical protein [Magnetovibrio sp.]